MLNLTRESDQPTHPKLGKLVVAIALLFLILTTLATTSHADYNVKILRNSAQVSIAGDLLQGVPSSSANNTAEPFGTIPVFFFHFTGENASLFSNNLTLALRQRNTGASAEQVTLDSSSNGTNYHYLLNFNVDGIFSGQSDVDTIDMSWKSFAIAGDFKQNGTSLNAVLPAYLLSSLNLYAQLPANSGQPRQIARQWYWNRFILQRGIVVSTMQDQLMFNYTGLNAPLQSWTATPDTASHTVRYRMMTGFNLTYIETFFDPEGNANFARDIIYKITATVDLPWNSVVTNNSVMVESPTALGPFVMLSIIISTIVILALVVLAERRFTMLQTVQRGKKTKR